MIEAKVNGSAPLTVQEEKGKWQLQGMDGAADLKPVGDSSFHVILNGRSAVVHVVAVDREEKTVRLLLNGKKATVSLTTELDRLLSSMGLSGAATAKASEIKAPMPGLIHQIKVAEGDTVKKGDPVLILEAMKMENVIKSPADGIIGKILAQPGASVEKGAVLIRFQ